MSHHLKYRRLSYEENDREHEAFDDSGSDDGHDYLGPLGYAAWLVQELVGLGLVREDIEPITPRMVAILVQRMHFFHKYAISMGNYCYLCTVILKRVIREGALSCA